MVAKAVRRVLVVDDEETLTWSMTKTLAKDRDQYELIIANTGTDALNILKQVPVDVVVTDIRMPDINGLDLLSMIRESYPSTKVIIMTAYGSPEVHKEATRRGSYFYIEKPFEISEIRKLILKALDEKKGGFVGQVVDLQLVDIIQMACLGRFTMSLTITRGEERGLIYFQNGEIAHAEVGDLEGKDALYTILDWNEGRFNSQMGITPPKVTITDRWEHLLLDGMRRQDEARAAEEIESTVLLHEVEQAFEDLDKQVAIKESLERMLRILANIDGYQKGCWMDTKGNLVTLDGQSFSKQETAMPIVVFTTASRLGRYFNDLQPMRVKIGFKNNEAIIIRYNNLYLMVFLDERTTADEFFSIAGNILERRLSGT